jgi:hypothetical protein
MTSYGLISFSEGRDIDHGPERIAFDFLVAWYRRDWYKVVRTLAMSFREQTNREHRHAVRMAYLRNEIQSLPPETDANFRLIRYLLSQRDLRSAVIGELQTETETDGRVSTTIPCELVWQIPSTVELHDATLMEIPRGIPVRQTIHLELEKCGASWGVIPPMAVHVAS